jgi:hypothetical protein
MYACSPSWDADWIEEDVLEEGLTELAAHIQPSPWGAHTMSLNHGLHFTGGEPFLNYALLLKAVEMATDLGIPSTFVETNCYWCRDDQGTAERLVTLRDRGLVGIMISVNPFYAEYVPFDRTERCIRTSYDVFGPNVMVYQTAYYDQFRRLGIRERTSLEHYLERTGDGDLAGRVELFLMGRAARQLRAFYPKYPAHVLCDEPCRPPFLRNWHNHFDNYGHLIPGYCGGISLGSWRDLDALTAEGIDVDTHPVLGYLIAGDMRGLLRFARDYGYQESEGGYLSKCDLCLDLRAHLATHDAFEELAPAAFYRQLD